MPPRGRTDGPAGDLTAWPNQATLPPPPSGAGSSRAADDARALPRHFEAHRCLERPIRRPCVDLRAYPSTRVVRRLRLKPADGNTDPPPASGQGLVPRYCRSGSRRRSSSIDWRRSGAGSTPRRSPSTRHDAATIGSPGSERLVRTLTVALRTDNRQLALNPRHPWSRGRTTGILDFPLDVSRVCGYIRSTRSSETRGRLE